MSVPGREEASHAARKKPRRLQKWSADDPPTEMNLRREVSVSGREEASAAAR
jgi:hypothetical protein